MQEGKQPHTNRTLVVFLLNCIGSETQRNRGQVHYCRKHRGFMFALVFVCQEEG